MFPLVLDLSEGKPADVRLEEQLSAPLIEAPPAWPRHNACQWIATLPPLMMDTLDDTALCREYRDQQALRMPRNRGKNVLAQMLASGLRWRSACCGLNERMK